jgi:hypothetical protein
MNMAGGSRTNDEQRGSGTLDEPSEDYGSWFAQCFVQSWEACVYQ